MLPGKQENIFKQWIDEHIGLILKVVRANAVDPEDQNDLFQEIAFQLWQSIPAFQKRARESTWIYKIALNTSLVWHRAQKKHSHIYKSLDFIHDISDTSEDTSKSLESREKLDWIYGEIRKLSRVDRALVLLYLDEYSYQEMSDIIGISVNNVGVKLNRIKKRFITLMKGHYHEE